MARIKLTWCVIALSLAVGCTNPEWNASSAALSATTYTQVDVAAQPLLRLRVQSEQNLIPLSMRAVVGMGPTSGGEEIAVVDAACALNLGRAQINCADLGWVGVTIEPAGERLEVTADLSTFNLSQGLDVRYVIVGGSSVDFSGVEVGEKCFGGGSRSIPQAKSRCYPVEDLPGQVCCTVMCTYLCQRQEEGGYVWTSEECGEPDLSSCRYVPAGDVSAPAQVLPAF